MHNHQWAVGLGLVSFGVWATELGCDSDVDATAASTASSVSASSASQGGGGQNNVGGAGGSGGAGGVPPSECSDFEGVALVASTLFLGDLDWDGMASSTAWTLYGANLDGLDTQNGDLAGHCQPTQGASPAALNDGPNGIDNSWGKALVPIMAGLEPQFSQAVNDGIANGDGPSLLLKLDALGAAPDQAPVVAKLYQAAPLLAPALFDGSDCWPVAYESLQVPSDPESALTIFPTSSVASDLWQSESSGMVVLEIDMQGFAMPLRILHARLSMQLDADHQGATFGQLTGVIDTEELIEAIRDVAGSFSPELCQGTTFDSIANQLRQASDIMTTGTQDPNATCNAISVGIGFHATAVQFGAVAPEKPPPPDPCP